jgi:hypothetical protein
LEIRRELELLQFRPYTSRSITLTSIVDNILTLATRYKLKRNVGHEQRSLNGSSTDPKDVESMGIEDTRLEIEHELGLLYFTPYREDPAGRFCYYICVLTSAHV